MYPIFRFLQADQSPCGRVRVDHCQGQKAKSSIGKGTRRVHGAIAFFYLKGTSSRCGSLSMLTS